MEKLPDELWLLIFNSLHKFDVIYSFHDLNLRFQNLIRFYASSIDLSDLSFKVFLRFCRETLPIHGHMIQRLTIKGTHQLNVFGEEYILLKRMNNLQCLTLAQVQVSTEKLDVYLKQIPSLNTLHLKLSHNSELRLENILSKNMLFLTNLSLLEHNSYYFENVNIIAQSGTQLPQLKILTIEDLKTTNDLYYLFKMMYNLEELNLCISKFDPQSLLDNAVPQLLTIMRLEITCTLDSQQTMNLLREFLFLFKKQLKSLKLIIYSMEEKFVTELNDIIKTNFPNIVSFDYSFEILNQPTETLATVSGCFNIMLNANFFKMTLQKLKNYTTVLLDVDDRHSQIESLLTSNDLLLPKLYKVYIYEKFFSSDLRIRFYSKLLSISPNIRYLYVNHSNSEATINLLSKLPKVTKLMIKNLSCRNSYKECESPFHETYIIELSQILPKLKELILETPVWPETSHEKYLTPILAIMHSRKYFKSLIHLRLKLKIHRYQNDVGGVMVQKMDEALTAYLKDDQYKNLFYETIYSGNQLYIIDVWF
ncbi:unnamed protein product [Rotaria magnacalcarata]|uniref:F-box domain-containing protein n=3 Tax=Rotaria magnacalcarata TaxID=392030 RepID=A0A816KSJ1_9BILA|nr:unnamed protein product [Rotaria magnacalcarata]CAF4131098.1 unnamed protein product [Rotaria magnacalcarata]